MGLSGCTSGSPSARTGDIVLMPHHLIVKPIIEQMYADMADEVWPQIIIVSPDHFHQGATHISTPVESEFGFTIHRDYALATWPGVPVTGYMVQNEATKEEVDSFVDTLAATPALVIFSIDFSHYLPGDVSRVHDLRSMDILASRSIDEARSIEADCPTALEIMLKLAAAKGETLNILRNTNPAYDAGIRTFENTTHIFAHSQLLAPGESPPARSVSTTMFFAHPPEWYLGKSAEDRYTYGYDHVLWDQGGTDQALVETTGQPDKTFTFDYF